MGVFSLSFCWCPELLLILPVLKFCYPVCLRFCYKRFCCPICCMFLINLNQIFCGVYSRIMWNIRKGQRIWGIVDMQQLKIDVGFKTIELKHYVIWFLSNLDIKTRIFCSLRRCIVFQDTVWNCGIFFTLSVFIDNYCGSFSTTHIKDDSSASDISTSWFYMLDALLLILTNILAHHNLF